MQGPDLSVFQRQKTIVDQQQLQDAFELKKALAQAELQKALRPSDFDVKSLGQQALVKQQLGIPLTPQDQAFANVYSATTEGVYTDLYGNSIRKPGVMERLGAPQINSQPQPSGITGSPPPNLSAMNNPQANDVVIDLFGNGNNTGANGAPLPSFNPKLNAGVPVSDIPPNAGMDDVPNEWDLQYQKQRAALLARGDRKSAQDLDVAYAKSKIEMTADQSKNAGFADRMVVANPAIKQYEKAGLNNTDVRLDRNLPDFIANRVVSGDYQSFNQAQRDFINAQLRRESGAVIADSEFDNAAKQYFPQVGDGEQVLLQKEANRNNALKAMINSAGPAYNPTVVKPPPTQTPKFKEGAIADGPNGEIQIYMNGAWKPYKGKK